MLFPDLPRVTMTLDTTDDNATTSSQSDAQSGAFLSPNVQFTNLHDEEEPADERNPLYLDLYNSGSSGSNSPTSAFLSPNVQFTSLHEEEQPSELFTRNPLYRELVMEVPHHIIHALLPATLILTMIYRLRVPPSMHFNLHTPFYQLLDRQWGQNWALCCSPTFHVSP